MYVITTDTGSIVYCSGSQPFLYGGTLLSYLNFRGTSIILVNNKKVFTYNLSMISQFSSQYMVISNKKTKKQKEGLHLKSVYDL